MRIFIVVHKAAPILESEVFEPLHVGRATCGSGLRDHDERNNALADEYRALAAQEQNVIFGGRLAEYKYYDMAPIVEKVLGMEI